MNADGVVVRPMSEAELGLALDWAANEGWNPGLDDAASFFAADPGGFLVAECGGERVGCVSAVRYSADFGFLGLYIVRAEFRGRGVGMALWRAAMVRLAGRVVGLDGVVAQQANYARSGFRLAWRNVRYEGIGDGAPPDGLIDLSTIGFDEVARCDRSVFPSERAAFLRGWIRPERGAALGLLGEGGLKGFGVVRACRRGFKIGPLIADEADGAERLFVGLAARAAGAPLFLDAPEINPAAIALAERHGMAPMFETARMYSGPTPQGRLDRLFGVSTFELG
jgi:hypothetical protein